VQRLKAPKEFEKVYQSSRWIVEDAKKTGMMPGAYAPQFPDVNAKAAEARALATQIQAKFITGEMGLDEWDAAVKDWMSKYGFMTDTLNKWVDDNKAMLKAKGVKIFDQ